jgi:hypothetical protein
VKSHLRDVASLAAAAARVLVRHWPVLVALATAGWIGRVVLVRTAVYLAGVSAVAGFAVLLLAPLAVLAAVVLMLRTVRPSLGISGPAPEIATHLGSLLIPFVGFYLWFGLFDEDQRAYGAGVSAGRGVNLAAAASPARFVLMLGVVVVAIGLRMLLGGLRRPGLDGPTAALEVTAILLGLLYLAWPFATAVWDWVQARVAWHALAGWWDRVQGAPLPGTANRWLVDAFPAGYVSAVFLVPLTGLVTAIVALGVVGTRVGDARRSGIRQHRATPGHRYEPLLLGLVAVRRTGVVPLMMVCLAVTLLQSAAGWLRLAEAGLIGPYDPDGVAAAYQPSVDVANRIVVLVVLVAILAGAAQLVARHQAEPAPAEPEGNAAPAMPTAPPPQWPLPQPAWAGSSEGKLTPPAWPPDPPPS